MESISITSVCCAATARTARLVDPADLRSTTAPLVGARLRHLPALIGAGGYGVSTATAWPVHAATAMADVCRNAADKNAADVFFTRLGPLSARPPV